MTEIQKKMFDLEMELFKGKKARERIIARARREFLSKGRYEESGASQVRFEASSADKGLTGMMRYGMLALNLMPIGASSGNNLFIYLFIH